MKQRLLFLLVALVGMTMQSVGQVDLVIKMPKVKKIVKLTATNVNFRMAPSTSSPKLGWIANEGMWISWLNNNERSEMPIDVSVMPVIGESGDWYKVYLSIPYEDEQGKDYHTETAYVMKKFCKDVVLRPLRLPAPNGIKVSTIKDSKYKDFCLCLTDDGDFTKALHIGKYKDGMFVFGKRTLVFSNIGKYYKEEGSHFQKDVNHSEWLRYIYDDNLATDSGLDLGKLVSNSKELNFLFSNLSKTTDDTLVFYGIEEDNTWYPIVLSYRDMSNYEGETTTY